jgi:hypothetical protein
LEVEPSLQVTVLAAASLPPLLDEEEALDALAAGAGVAPLLPLPVLVLLAAAVAFLSMPPWPRQAPLPPLAVLPSLQVTVVPAVLSATAGRAGTDKAARMMDPRTSFSGFMVTPLCWLWRERALSVRRPAAMMRRAPWRFNGRECR